MRRVACLLPVMMMLLLAGGCSLFSEILVSRQDSLQTGSLKQSLDWKVDSVGSRSRVLSYTDSSGAQFEVDIVPSGAFTFSAHAGFAGSASMVRLRGKTKANSTAVDSSGASMQIRSSGSLEQKVKTKTKTTKTQKAKTGNNSLSCIGILSAACLLILVAVKSLSGMNKMKNQ